MLLSEFDALVVPEVPGCPLPSVRAAVVVAARKLCEDYWLLRDSAAITTVAGTATYVLTPVDAANNEVFAVYAAHIGTLELGPLTEDAHYRALSTQGPPSQYAFDGQQLRPLPIPDNAYDLIVEFTVRPKRTTQTTLDDRFIQYMEAVGHYAKYHLMSMTGQPWANPSLALFNNQRYKAFADGYRWRDARANTNAVLSVTMRPAC